MNIALYIAPPSPTPSSSVFSKIPCILRVQQSKKKENNKKKQKQKKLELVFVKHYAPNCLTLTLFDSNTA